MDIKQQNSKNIALYILVIFYTAGLVGMLIPILHPIFCKLTPLVLLLTFLILISFHQKAITLKTASILLLIYLIGLVIEIIGVNTGIIFGNYRYGQSLGFKILNTPLIIGINWLLLVYTSASVIEKFKIPSIAKIVGASAIMVIFDFVLEKVAPKLDMWHWENTTVPIINYVAWFITALVMHIILKAFKISTNNKIAFSILATQFLFFLSLSILL